ncbi:hypothetical protein AN964_23025 [Heyndrickxia shackletonii]|uniref:DUF1835 domain-containing protein n=1 Tax=Heyndrickxia shackletonii TaxID=157838 RepID=A0A0Q3WQK2_9BACI|nr:DUF1835 domain-containing protein [Heyndrickxia shackletonii]KQL50533.1 hypothetical protein AN964_23025 [Heyndrickxia shackletonii]NEY98159.1 DUF1835 domain-containing protein [Heyndrickxia shackletonii]
MKHIIFGASASGSLKFVLREMGLNKEEVIAFWDTFSIGPIWKLHEENGVKSRFEWMKKCISDEYDEFPDYKKRFRKTINEIASIPEGTQITIWTSDNAHEQIGMRMAMYLLKEKNMDISIINTTEEYEQKFRIKKMKYSLLHSGEIPLEKFQFIYEHGHRIRITDHDREKLENEWISLSDNKETLRIWQNGRIQIVPEDFFDDFIIKKAKKLHGNKKQKDFMKSARLIGEVLGHLEQYVGDEFLEYRLKKLIEAGIFEAEGSLAAMRFYNVRLVGKVPN